jgi:hypothetical protein
VRADGPRPYGKIGNGEGREPRGRKRQSEHKATRNVIPWLQRSAFMGRRRQQGNPGSPGSDGASPYLTGVSRNPHPVISSQHRTPNVERRTPNAGRIYFDRRPRESLRDRSRDQSSDPAFPLHVMPLTLEIMRHAVLPLARRRLRSCRRRIFSFPRPPRRHPLQFSPFGGKPQLETMKAPCSRNTFWRITYQSLDNGDQGKRDLSETK